MSGLEEFEPFAHKPSDRRETSEFRSSWLASSLRGLRRRDLIDAYRAKLPKRFHAPILESVVGQWLPIEVAVAHYAAMDALHLPPSTAFEMGAEIQEHAQSSVASFAVRVSKSAGVTPWTILGYARKLWDRTWRGGDFAIYKPGPKEAQIEIVGWSCAPSTYVHQSFRGVFEGISAPLCTRSFARLLPEKTSGTSIAYRLSWV